MIKKALFFSLSLFLLYNIFLILFKTNIYIPQNQFQENVIKAQEFLYSDRNKENVIVGSSISTKLDANVFPDNFFNLSFRAQSIFDGLEIIKRSRIVPKRIFIETNMYLVPSNPKFNENLFTPFMHAVRKHIPALQEKNQLINTFSAVCYSLLATYNKDLAQKIGRKLGQKVNHNPTDSIFKKLLEPQLLIKNKSNKEPLDNSFQDIIDLKMKEYAVVPPAGLIRKQLNSLKYFVNYFKSMGVEIIFYEMPMKAEIYHSVKSEALRTKFSQIFPPQLHNFIQSPDCRYFNTNDGIHLDDQSATSYSLIFVKESMKLKASNDGGK